MSKSFSSMLLLLLILNLSAVHPITAQPPVCDPEAALRLIAIDLHGNPIYFDIATMSGNGRYVAYDSENDYIVPDDTNQVNDIFIYDRLDCSTRRVTLNAQGEQSNSSSYTNKLSEDGRYLLLDSHSTNFHPSYTNNFQASGLFLLDLQTQTYQYVGLNANMPGDMSADGRYVVFVTREAIDPNDTDNRYDLYVYDRDTETYDYITDTFEGDPMVPYHIATISADGAYIAFSTNAPGLFLEDTNGFHDIFLYERATGNVRLITTSPQGLIGNADSLDWPALSADGRYVVFQSRASNLVPDDTEETNDVFLYDRITEEITCISVNELGQCGRDGSVHNYKSSISADGRYIFYHKHYFSQTHGVQDAFLIYDRELGETKWISLTEDGQPMDASWLLSTTKTQYMSADGRWAIFWGDGGLHLTDWQQLSSLTVSVTRVDSFPVNDTNGLQAGEVVQVNANALRLAFSEALQDPAGNTEAHDVTNPANYRLIRADDPAEITATTCAGSVIGGAVVSAQSVTYTLPQNQASMNFASPLENGAYRLIVCNLVGINDNPLDGNGDFVGGDAFMLNFAVDVPDTVATPFLYLPENYANVSTYYPEFVWTTAAGAVSYEIQIDSVNPPQSTPVAVAGNSYTPDVALPLGQNYARVRAVGIMGERSEWSTVLFVEVQVNPANARPARNHFSVTPPVLTWSAVDWATGYEIQIDDQVNFSSPDYSAEVAADGLQITLGEDDLAKGVYYWRVRAQRANGTWGGWSAVDEFAYRLYEWWE